VLDNEPLMNRVGLALLAGGIFLGACVPQKIQFAPLRVEPIHMTVDVNIHDKEKSAKPGEAASDAKD
jgi:hypothetical protein